MGTDTSCSWKKAWGWVAAEGRAEIGGWKSQETPRFFLVIALSPDELVRDGGDLAPGVRLGESRI